MGKGVDLRPAADYGAWARTSQLTVVEKVYDETAKTGKPNMPCFEKKACVISLAERFTLSQNGYGVHLHTGLICTLRWTVHISNCTNCVWCFRQCEPRRAISCLGVNMEDLTLIEPKNILQRYRPQPQNDVHTPPKTPATICAIRNVHCLW